MDTMTTIQSLLKCNGSARPVTVALMPSEARLIAAAPDLLAAIRPFAIGQPRDITEADLIACERAYRKANGGDVARTSGMGEV